MARRWQPQKVIDALTDCDPYVQNDSKIVWGSHQSGEAIAFESKGVSKALIKDYWHKLGSFLHASMSGAKAVGVDVVPFLHKTIEALRAYEETTALANFGPKAEFKCLCGRTIKRNMEALKATPRVTCPDAECGMIWDFVGQEKGNVVFKPARKSFTCPSCQETNFYDERFAFDGVPVTCGNCEARLLLSLVAVMPARPPTEGSKSA